MRNNKNEDGKTTSPSPTKKNLSEFETSRDCCRGGVGVVGGGWGLAGGGGAG